MVSVLGVAVESKKWFQFFQFFSFFILRLGCVKSAENLAKIHQFFSKCQEPVSKILRSAGRAGSYRTQSTIQGKNEKMKNSSQWRHFRSPLFRRQWYNKYIDCTAKSSASILVEWGHMKMAANFCYLGTTALDKFKYSFYC